METFLARRQHNSSILYIGIERIACTDIETTTKRTGENDLSLRGNLGLHSKIILPSWACLGNSESNDDSKCRGLLDPKQGLGGYRAEYQMNFVLIEFDGRLVKMRQQ